MRTRRYRRRPERKGMREDNKKKNSGFTLVEVLVAVAILAVISIPIIQSFVSVAQVNGKARRRMIANTIAESLMEACKSTSMLEIAAQCDGCIAITCIASETTMSGAELGSGGGASTTKTAKKDSTTNLLSFVDSSGYNVVVVDAAGNNVTRRRHSFKISNIGMSGGSYEAYIDFTTSLRDKTEVSLGGSKTVKSVLNGEGLRVLRFYDVEIRVYRSGASAGEPLSVIRGSITDYN